MTYDLKTVEGRYLGTIVSRDSALPHTEAMTLVKEAYTEYCAAVESKATTVAFLVFLMSLHRDKFRVGGPHAVIEL